MTEVQFIENALSGLGEYVVDRYKHREEVHVTTKTSINDLLTEVDTEVQRRLTEQIARAYPGDEVVGEEGGGSKAPSSGAARCWVIDPIDGTQNFVRGLFPLFGISIGFAVAGEVIAGGVALPILGDTFLAEKGAGAFRNGRRIHVSAIASIEEARGELDVSHLGERNKSLDVFLPLLQRLGQLRHHGSAVVGLCSIASGDMDAFLHISMSPWDYAAGHLIVQEAGGQTSRLDGSPIRLFDGKDGLLATNGALHAALLDHLSRTMPQAG